MCFSCHTSCGTAGARWRSDSYQCHWNVRRKMVRLLLVEGEEHFKVTVTLIQNASTRLAIQHILKTNKPLST